MNLTNGFSSTYFVTGPKLSGKKFVLKGNFGGAYLAETGMVEHALNDLFNLIDYTMIKKPLYQKYLKHEHGTDRITMGYYCVYDNEIYDLINDDCFYQELYVNFLLKMKFYGFLAWGKVG